MRFEVGVLRTSSSTATFVVEAENEEEAKVLAINKAHDHDFGSGRNADYEINSIEQK
jgi:hypothetical protein